MVPTDIFSRVFQYFWSFVRKTLLDARLKAAVHVDYGQIHIIHGLWGIIRRLYTVMLPTMQYNINNPDYTHNPTHNAIHHP